MSYCHIQNTSFKATEVIASYESLPCSCTLSNQLYSLCGNKIMPKFLKHGKTKLLAIFHK